MKRKLSLSILLLLLFTTTFSTNNLRIIDPDWGWWYTYPASIKKAELQIKPLGSYIENTLYLTIGLQDPYTEDGRQLEIILDFELPSNSLVIDSWLWIDGKPKQAEILDRWTASSIYEEIVDRRKDPSLLVKSGANQYTINVYPLKPNETRKFKITYLTPVSCNKDIVTCEYPLGILKSGTQPQELTVYIYPNDYFSNPSIINSTSNFIQYSGDDYGDCYRVNIKNSDFGKADITLTDSNPNKVKFYKYGTEDEGIYQISFIPSEVIEQNISSKKVCYLIDFDKSYTQYSKSYILEIISSNILNSMSERDSFNVIFSNLELKQSFNNWKPVTAANIEEAFSGVIVSDYSNMLQLLVKGITFANSAGDKGKIVLISNNSAFEGTSKSNEILNDIKNLNVNKLHIDVINYMDQVYNSYWVGNSYYYGNEYLLSNIARMNSGNYTSFYNNISGSNFSSLMIEAIQNITSGVIDNLDIYTKTETGFCFGRINFTTGIFSNYMMNKAVHQIGKYKGQFPLKVDISGEVNDILIHSEIDLKASDAIESDSVLQTIWSGLDLLQLEKENQNSQVINEIINQSIENRILSYYTAFLCLEDTISIPEDNDDFEGGDVITSAETKNLSSNMKAYPNPFINEVEINLPDINDLQKLEIFNVMGQRIKEFNLISKANNYKWDGLNDNGSEVNEGIYLVVASYNDKVLTLKIQKL